MNQVTNHKADRQQAKREAKAGNRFDRQRNQHREPSNVRIRQCVNSSAPFMGYSYIRIRDGKTV